MLILLLGGLFAIIFGRISILRNIKLRGKFARLYGLALIFIGIPLILLIGMIALPFLPQLKLGTLTSTLIDLALIVLIVVLTGIPFAKWQKQEGGNISSDRAASKNTNQTFKILFIILAAFLVVTIFAIATCSYKVIGIASSVGNAATEAREYSKNHTAEECFNEGYKRMESINTATLSTVDTLKSLGFFKECLKSNSTKRSWCGNVPVEADVAGSWVAKTCTNLNTEKCSLLANLAIEDCKNYR